jgi:hypothetical protein
MRGKIIASAVAIALLLAAAWWLPDLRRSLIYDATWWDAPPGEPPALTAGTGPGLSKTPRTRVILVDGLIGEVTHAMKTWSTICKRGLSVRVDVGFPTVSLPVAHALWTGLTQQQTGIVNRAGGRGGKYGHPLDPPLDRRGIPAQIAGSVAVAEDHGWIVRSLGFSKARPGPGAHPVDDVEPEAWKDQWEIAARYAVASDAPLTYVHVLRVDGAGHKFGVSAHYGRIAVEVDSIIERLYAADPGARWFLLSDHGHIGAHGGEEREVRQIEACIVGPGVTPGRGPLIHIVDVARAIADSTGATLDRESRGRPLSAALAAPVGEDQSVPPLDLTRGMLAIFLLAVGLGLSTWGVRRWWLAPWWFAVACGLLLLVQGEPTLSHGWVFESKGRAQAEVWAASLVLAVASTWIGLRRTMLPPLAALARVLAAQLAVPLFALAATITACGAWGAIFGAETAPITPRYTAWMFTLVLMVSHGAAAVALGVLARLVHQVIGRRAPAAPPRSDSEAGA